MKLRMLPFVTLGLLTLQRPAAAQARSDRESLELAVVRLVRESLPKGRIALLRPRDGSEARTIAHTKALVEALGGIDVIDTAEDSVMSCGNPDGACQLKGIDGTISIRVDSIGVDEAEVDVFVQTAWPSPPHTSYIGSTWSASRVRGVWRIEAKSVRRS